MTTTCRLSFSNYHCSLRWKISHFQKLNHKIKKDIWNRSSIAHSKQDLLDCFHGCLELINENMTFKIVFLYFLLLLQHKILRFQRYHKKVISACF
jgi:predicted transcriptional regulator